MLVNKFQNDFLRPKSYIETDFRDFSLIKAGFVDNIIINHCKFPGFFCRLIFKFRLVKIVTNKNYLSLFGNLFLDGYYISDESFGSEIQSLKDKIRQTHAIKKKKGCAIHVRAGDLLRQPENMLITKDYYKRSIEILNKKYNVHNFLIVTENIQFAETFFSDLEEEYLFEYQSSTEIDDFITLLEYEFLICANSTFSWIAGLLGESKIFISTDIFINRQTKKIK